MPGSARGLHVVDGVADDDRIRNCEVPV